MQSWRLAMGKSGLQTGRSLTGVLTHLILPSPLSSLKSMRFWSTPRKQLLVESVAQATSPPAKTSSTCSRSSYVQPSPCPYRPQMP